jgi:alpha-acetolactate decarboxylase
MILFEGRINFIFEFVEEWSYQTHIANIIMETVQPKIQANINFRVHIPSTHICSVAADG